MWINRQYQNLPDKIRLIYLHVFNINISLNNNGCTEILPLLDVKVMMNSK